MLDIEIENTECILCFSNESSLIAEGYDYEYEISQQVFKFVQCSNCKHVYLNPRPVIESACLIYPAHYYTNVDKDNVSLLLSILQKIKDYILYSRISSLLEVLRQGAKVIELGAGDGSLVCAINKYRPDLQLFALDLNFTDRVKEDLMQKKISIIELPLESADIKEKFDLIIMNQLIEHLWDVRRSITIIRGMLNTQGMVSITTPNINGYDREFFQKGAWGGFYYPRHLNLFSKNSLKQLFLEYGFSIDTQKSLVAPMIWNLSFFYLLKKKGNRFASFFIESNLPVLGVFTIFDLLAILSGKETSNQQIIAIIDE